MVPHAGKARGQKSGNAEGEAKEPGLIPEWAVHSFITRLRDYWSVTRIVLTGVRQRLKENAYLRSEKSGLSTSRKKP